MKIGIMSMHRILNYGSFMQALSLKLMLEELGHEVEFVDYHVGPLVNERKNYKKILKKRLKQTYFGETLKQIYYKCFLRRSIWEGEPDKVQSFVSCYPMLGIDKKKRYRSKVDVLIIGSDEVFNCIQNNRDVGYSMELFGKSNRAKRLISYAASFGNATYDKLQQYGVCDELSYLLKRFDAISVRDNNSFDIICRLTGEIPTENLDPVLVGGVEKLNWASHKEQDYIIVYGYANRFSASEAKIIQKFAKQKKLKTIGLCEPQNFCDENIRCRPDEIISYFKHASYVVTDTFHGVIFATICHVPFAAYCRSQSDSGFTNQEKLMDLLNRLKLTNRLMKEGESLNAIFEKKIDFESIDTYRLEERNKTIEFLKRNIK